MRTLRNESELKTCLIPQMTTPHIEIINAPNLNLLGVRETRHNEERAFESYFQKRAMYFKCLSKSQQSQILMGATDHFQRWRVVQRLTRWTISMCFILHITSYADAIRSGGYPCRRGTSGANIFARKSPYAHFPSSTIATKDFA